VKFSGPNGLEWKNEALYSIFESDFGKGICNPMESRIVKLYQLLDKGIMPWMWDYENYTGPNKDMHGFFYPEDLAAIEQIRQLESAKAKNAKH